MIWQEGRLCYRLANGSAVVFVFGIIFLVYGMYIISYVAEVDPTPERVVSYVVLHASMVMAIWSYLKVVLTEPGYVIKVFNFDNISDDEKR